MFSMTQVVRNSLSFLFVLSRTFLSCLRLTFNFKSRLLLFLFCHHIWMFWKKLGQKSAFESWCCSNRSKGRTQTRWKLHAGPCMHTADSRMRITNRGMLRLGECWDWDTWVSIYIYCRFWNEPVFKRENPRWNLALIYGLINVDTDMTFLCKI